MSENTKIEWCDHTFNPWEGCQKAGPGCDNCYAEARNARFSGGQAINWGPGAPRRRTSEDNWGKPTKWQAKAPEFMAQHGRRQRVFCSSLADVFDNAVSVQWRISLMRLILETPDLDWLLLTKRIGNATEMLDVAFRGALAQRERWADVIPANVWIGATVCNQAEADRDIPKLLATPARVRFLSIEPMLGPIDLGLRCENSSNDIVMDPETGAFECCKACDYTGIGNAIDWVICGGESGSGARPMHPDWARSLRDQCAAAAVPFLFKQWGAWIGADQDACPYGPPASRWMWGDGTPFSYRGPAGDGPLLCRAGKKTAGRLLDGIEHNAYPKGAP